jgi:hypothetical protein
VGLVKALSLTQPWASLVAIGAKRIETRSWATHYRGPVAIHAAKGFPRECRDLVGVEPFRSALLAGIAHGRLARHESGELPLGAIVAVARLTSCLRFTPDVVAQLEAKYGAVEMAFGAFGTGRYGFVLEGVQALETPIPCKGALGIWQVPSEITVAYGRQLHSFAGGAS